MDRRVKIRWTATAKQQLAKLPLKVRQGLLAKVAALRETDPTQAHKPLVGPLQGHDRITYSRYRAIYRVQEEELESGDVLVQLLVTLIAVGQRKERDRKDVYALAQKLVDLGIIDLTEEDDPSSGL